jgi:hypothetical protein
MAPTDCKNVININGKGISAACLGTSVPISGEQKSSVDNQCVEGTC